MWNHDISAAPKDARLWLASHCGKVIGPTAWDEKRGQFAGFATKEQPIAWQPYVVPAHPSTAQPMGINTSDHEFMAVCDSVGGDV